MYSNLNIRHNENAMHIEKYLQFDKLFSLSQKGTLSYKTKNNRVLLKRAVLLDLKVNDFCWKRGVFYRGGV